MIIELEHCRYGYYPGLSYISIPWHLNLKQNIVKAMNSFHLAMNCL